MNLHRGLASLFVVLALTGCAQVATIQGQPPNPPYSPANNGEYLRDRAVMAAQACSGSGKQTSPGWLHQSP